MCVFVVKLKIKFYVCFQEKFVLPFGRWMSRKRDDEEIMRELPVVRAGHESEALPGKEQIHL